MLVLQGSETYTFPCGRWLARDEDDGAIERELVATKVTEEVTRGDGTVKKRDRKLDNVLEGDVIHNATSRIEVL